MTERWKLKRTAQCQKCPWLKSVDPHEIPNGYSVEKHRALKSTIANPADPLSSLSNPHAPAMACHESHDAHCIGWLMQQLGPGHNIGLRIRALSCENIGKIRLRGEQHARFEDTLPAETPRRKRATP